MISISYHHLKMRKKKRSSLMTAGDFFMCHGKCKRDKKDDGG